MSQSRTMSAVESVVNVAIGYCVAVVSQIAIFPLFSVHLPLAENMAIGGYFTVISLARSYVIRRLFVRKT